MAKTIHKTGKNGDALNQTVLKIPVQHLALKPSMVARSIHLTKTAYDCFLTSRESEKWKLIYKRRTSVERSNKREKIDYKLESGRHRSTKMWYIRVYGIMICQHLDAWFTHLKDSFADLKSLIFPKVD